MPALAAWLLALLILTAASSVSACIDKPRINLQPQSDFVDASDKTIRFGRGKVDQNQDDMLYILLPKSAKVDTGNVPLNRIVDMRVLDSPRFRELAPILAMEAMVPLQNSRNGYTWWAFRAMGGITILTTDIGAKRTATNINVRSHIPPAPEPIKISLEKATQENLFDMTAGQAFEITLPGELADGWNVDNLKETGVTLKSLTQASSVVGAGGSSQPGARLLFEASGNSASSSPRYLSLRHGGKFSGENFNICLVFYSVPAC
ncbi:hypothetical protein [Noviherbaspirillum autotrophicum]|uniref:Uncharacterized protein n=1 Tax=Noviherbaspirillum autotrophicum TaxID=709839 RepID=A0A0C1YMC9_9BURK|nr:hypothetical protein [Noviherbaspirillum autotrophicum]KIF81692.1 hypothetical protein TSA66_14280 [Noviherbaspirillum autotrophicum]KIF82059.1 hypothetical protein TSA66_16645 [Noviherbaspirillum autotrophicum]KIF84147.1 hypothetical protein TSA66_00375 [Noviherbaspirillum autotrophicum]